MHLEIKEAARRDAVVLISDLKYLPPAFFIASKLVDQPDRDFDVVVLLVGTPAKDCQPPDRRIIVRDFVIDPRLVRFAADNRRPLVTLGKLGLGTLAGDYDRILYLDSDVWIADRSVGDVLKTDMGRYAVAAVRDTAEVVRGASPIWLDYKSKLGMPSGAPYFNAGVMLIDLARFVERDIAGAALRYILEGNYLGPMNDQSAFNAVLRGDWLELSPVWNWMFASRDALTREVKPHIIHFVGSSKPWNDTRGRYSPHYALAMRHQFEASGSGNFVREQTAWPRCRWLAINAMRNLCYGHIENKRTRSIRHFISQSTFAKGGTTTGQHL